MVLRSRHARKSTRVPVSTKFIIVFLRREGNVLFVTNTPSIRLCLFFSVIDVLRIVVKIVITAACRIEAFFYPITLSSFQYYPLSFLRLPLPLLDHFPRSSESPASARTVLPQSAADAPLFSVYTSPNMVSRTSTHPAIPSYSCSLVMEMDPSAGGTSARTTR